MLQLKNKNTRSSFQNTFISVVKIIDKGRGYVINEETEDKFYLKRNHVGRALDGDKVKVQLQDSIYLYPKAKIIGIKERSRTIFTARLYRKGNQVLASLYPYQAKKIILKNLDTEIEEFDLAVIEIRDWRENHKSAYAKLTKVISNYSDTKSDYEFVTRKNGIHQLKKKAYDSKVNNDFRMILDKNQKNRFDLTNLETFTIDPKDAKDFDDALSFKKTKENNFEVGVHIADVTHYLKENTLLDKEASSRATSVYLSDRVVPMLPEILSNDLCSLNPNEDKNVFSVVVEFNSKFDIVKTNFSKSLINSDERMSYEEAQFILENKKQELPSSVTITGKNKKVKKEIKEALLTLNSIAVGLKEKRRKKGSVFFNKEEIRFVVDKKGEPVDYKIKTQKEANHLIEEFMLLANILVAKKIKEKKRTAVFRIHDYPDEQKILELERFTRNLGYNVRLSNVKDINTAINTLLKAVENKPEKNVIDMMVIRSMSKAKYSTNNIGHFGLGFNDYTHFTSPIRRYPDVIVHRLLHSVLLGTPQKQENLESTCLHCSKMEELATKAERSSIKLMQVKYMSKRINEKFDAVVSGLNERGVFVEIKENKCEGLVRMKDIPNDYFIYDQRNTCVVGQHTHEEYCLGDEVIIKVIGTDLDRKHIDFKILEKK